LILNCRDPEEAENPEGGSALRLIQDRLGDAELGKNLANLSNQFDQASITDSSSIKALNFSSARKTKRFPSSRMIARPVAALEANAARLRTPTALGRGKASNLAKKGRS